jgi:hypothetical protein
MYQRASLGAGWRVSMAAVKAAAAVRVFSLRIVVSCCGKELNIVRQHLTLRAADCPGFSLPLPLFS